MVHAVHFPQAWPCDAETDLRSEIFQVSAPPPFLAPCAAETARLVLHRDAGVGPALRIALQWWLDVLEMDIVEERSWHAPELPPARLFVDARSTPPRCSAILFINGRTLYCDGKPHDDIMRWFKERADGQITALEILAISLGLSTFCEELAGRKVVVYSDNTGAEVRLSARVRPTPRPQLRSCVRARVRLKEVRPRLGTQVL